MKTKILLIGVAVLLASQLLMANDHAYIQKTSEAIVVDGTGSEAVWSKATKYPFIHKNTTVKPTSDTDLSGFWQAAWTDAGIYIYADVTDDVLNNDLAFANWQTDGVEFYLFAFTKKDINVAPYNPCYDATQHGLRNIWMWRPENFTGYANRGRYTDADRSNVGTGLKFDCDNFYSKVYTGYTVKGAEKTGSVKGYTVEMYLPWNKMEIGKDLSITTYKPAVGDSLAFEIGVIDNDGNVANNKRRYWALPDNIGDAWSGADVCGRIIFTAESAIVPVKQSELSVTLSSSSKMITVSGEQPIKCVALYNIAGNQCMLKENIQSKEFKYRYSSLSSGIYTINVTDVNGNTKIQKLIIK